MAKKKERKEVLMRIVIGIITGIILYLWAYLICAFFIINFIYSIFSGKKLKELANLSEVWNLQVYSFFKYMNFVTNERPFPFENLRKKP